MGSSQIQAKLRQANERQRRAIRNYNTAARKHNNEVRRAVDNYNRDVRTYNAQVRRNRERLRREGLLMQQKGLRWLTSKDADDVRASEAVRSISEGFKLEALGLGEPTDRSSLEERLANPLEELSDDELERVIERLRDDLAGGASGASAPPA